MLRRVMAWCVEYLRHLTWKRAILLAFLVVFAIGGVGAIVSPPKPDKPAAKPATAPPVTVTVQTETAPPAASTAVAVPVVKPKPKPTPAHIVVVARESTCVPAPDEAHLWFFVTLKNTGGAAGTTTIRPWRRYNDASVNDGVVETTGDEPVAAHAEARYRTPVDWDVTAHYPIECRVYLGTDNTHYTSIEVVGP